MPSAPANALLNARSAYLRSATHQPVQWQEWTPEAFRAAVEQDKPILLDIGAVWCHWCHVMDRESYEDPETARIINEHFVAIKVDRDERPDIDARYQAAVAAISGGGGWPLTAFLTPQGKPFFGGTYFPPTDGHGRPSLRRVLMTMAEAFERRRGEVNESADSVIAAIEHTESFDGTAPLTIASALDLTDKLIATTLQQFDSQNGGFGAQPKFPNSAPLDLLIDTASRRGPDAIPARQAAILTLEKMSKGGIYDHLAGGFHRYSVDERWVVPHFEKMSYDNSALILNYVHAYQTFGEPECARIARETIRWVDEWLSDRDHGGFYASQDADESLADDGDYFTWTLAEANAALTPEQASVACPFYDIGELGDMHHNPQKNTLHVDRKLDGIAQVAGQTLEEARIHLAQARTRLYAARLQRPTPSIDKTIYVAWSSMMISAYLVAARVLEDPAAQTGDVETFALKSLDRTLAQAWNPETHTLRHVLAYAPDAPVQGTDLPGMLEDYVFTAHAALDAWEATGIYRYYQAALALAEATVARFHDDERSGFFDTEAPAAGDVPLGALTTRRKPLQDSPTPAANPVAAALLLRLADLTGRADLRTIAHSTLECFAAVVEHLGLYAATYGLTLRRFALPPLQVIILGEPGDPLAGALERTALARFAVQKAVIRLTPAQLTQLPPALAETLPSLPAPGGSFAVLCASFTCQPPIQDTAELAAALMAS